MSSRHTQTLITGHRFVWGGGIVGIAAAIANSLAYSRVAIALIVGALACFGFAIRAALVATRGDEQS